MRGYQKWLYVVALIWCAQALAASPAKAAKGPKAAAVDKERIIARIRTILPTQFVIGHIQPSPVPGLLEVMVGAEVLYVTEDARFVIKGSVFDLDNRENLTSDRRGRARVEAFDGLGVKNMLEFAGATTKHVVYVYTDVDCAYCRRFHQEVDKLNEAGVAVRYLFFPRSGPNTASWDKAVSVWCAADRQKAITDAKAGKEIENKTCPNPVQTHFDLGQSMAVAGTPAVFLANGEEAGGYVPADKLIEMVQAAARKGAKAGKDGKE